VAQQPFNSSHTVHHVCTLVPIQTTANLQALCAQEHSRLHIAELHLHSSEVEVDNGHPLVDWTVLIVKTNSCSLKKLFCFIVPTKPVQNRTKIVPRK